MSGNRIAPRPSNKTSDACDAFYPAGLWRARRAAALPRGAAPAPCCDPGAGHHKNKFEPPGDAGVRSGAVFRRPSFDLHAIAAAAATALRVVPTCRRPRVWARRAGGRQARPKKNRNRVRWDSNPRSHCKEKSAAGFNLCANSFAKKRGRVKFCVQDPGRLLARFADRAGKMASGEAI